MSEDFKTWYNRINNYTGPWAGAEAHEKVHSFWMASGQAGADYLADRLRDEGHIMAIEGVYMILADMGEFALSAIEAALKKGVKYPDDHRWFLKAIGNFPSETVDLGMVERIQTLLFRYIDHADPDVREAAVQATAVIPWGMAKPVLARIQDTETNPDVREAISEEYISRVANL